MSKNQLLPREFHPEMLTANNNNFEVKLKTTAMTVHTAQMELYDHFLGIKDGIEGAFMQDDINRMSFLESEYLKYIHQSAHHLVWMKNRVETAEDPARKREAKYLMEDVENWNSKMVKYYHILTCFKISYEKNFGKIEV